MSSSQLEHGFAVLYARREEERLAGRRVTRRRERAACAPLLQPLRRPS